jgi:hypothetical protein
MMIDVNMEQEAFRQRVDEIEQDHDYAGLVRQVESLYEELGVTVMRCVSTTGEDAMQFFIPKEKSSYPNYPA